MSLSGGADPHAVGEALCGWLSARFGGPVAMAEAPSTATGGLDSWIHLVRFTGAALPEPWRAPLVARVAPDAGRAARSRREAAVQGWCAAQGYPTPAVLAVLDPGDVLELPVQVMERSAGATMADALGRRPWTARSVLVRLAGLHAALHRLDPGPLVGGGDVAAGDLVARRLALPRDMAARLDHPGLAAALVEVEQLLPRLEGAPPSLCHGDLHPRNVLVAGADAQVIDWTDAGLGDRHADVARAALLFRFAAAAATGAERAALRAAAPVLAAGFVAAYRRRLPVDRARLALWEPVHLVHGWSQALAAEAGLLSGPAAAAPGGGALRPALATWWRVHLERRLADLS